MGDATSLSLLATASFCNSVLVHAYTGIPDTAQAASYSALTRIYGCKLAAPMMRPGLRGVLTTTLLPRLPNPPEIQRAPWWHVLCSAGHKAAFLHVSIAAHHHSVPHLAPSARGHYPRARWVKFDREPVGWLVLEIPTHSSTTGGPSQYPTCPGFDSGGGPGGAMGAWDLSERSI